MTTLELDTRPTETDQCPADCPCRTTAPTDTRARIDGGALSLMLGAALAHCDTRHTDTGITAISTVRLDLHADGHLTVTGTDRYTLASFTIPVEVLHNPRDERDDPLTVHLDFATARELAGAFPSARTYLDHWPHPDRPLDLAVDHASDRRVLTVLDILTDTEHRYPVGRRSEQTGPDPVAILHNLVTTPPATPAQPPYLDPTLLGRFTAPPWAIPLRIRPASTPAVYVLSSRDHTTDVRALGTIATMRDATHEIEQRWPWPMATESP